MKSKTLEELAEENGGIGELIVEETLIVHGVSGNTLEAEVIITLRTPNGDLFTHADKQVRVRMKKAASKNKS